MIATRWKHVGLVALGLAVAGCGDNNGPDPDPDNVAPTSSFTYECVDLECTFTDLSSDSDGTVEGFSWAFGDGQTASVRNPGVTFTEAGSYDVTLTVTDDDGEDAATTETVVVTEPAASSVVADFSVTCFSLECTFVDESTGPVTSWAWDFGDGSSSTVENPPAHTYDENALTDDRGDLDGDRRRRRAQHQDRELHGVAVRPPDLRWCGLHAHPRGRRRRHGDAREPRVHRP